MTDLARGDIVAFHFPYRCGHTEYARPCLVLDSDGEEVLLAYGTSSFTAANKGYEIRVLRDHADCGLTKPSRFVAARRIRVTRDDPKLGKRCRIGKLTPALMARIPRLLALLDQDFPTSTDRMNAERCGIHPTRSRRNRERVAHRRENSAVS